MKLCAWCRQPIPPEKLARRPDSIYCRKKLCKQSAWRLRRRRATDAIALEPKRAAYADPPYPGLAHYYRDQDSYAGEVDHHALIVRLCSQFDGWALSTSARGLREVLPMCPPDVRVCAWTKPIGVSSKTRGLHNAWEPLIVRPCRLVAPGLRDWISTPPARYRIADEAELIGRKPIRFCAFLFSALGLMPGDSFDDLFPGSGIVARAWGVWSSGAGANREALEQLESLLESGDRSPSAAGDRSPEPGSDRSSRTSRDRLRSLVDDTDRSSQAAVDLERSQRSPGDPSPLQRGDRTGR